MTVALDHAARAMLPSPEMTPTENDPLWRAVLARDRGYDGKLVYAVRTTGIYCRPSCASRRPRRENVELFALPEMAEGAGYRQCLRCKPASVVASDPGVRLVRRACRYIEDHVGEDLTLDRIGQRLGVSGSSLQRTFKRLTGISPRAYAESCRLRRARGVLREGGQILDALYGSGFESTSRLYGKAGGQLGMTPATYRRGAAGVRVQYAAAPCALGRVLVATTERGVCFVAVGASDASLVRALREELPAATFAAERAALVPALGRVLRYLEGKEPHVDLPVDVRATAFQRQVWDALQRIPVGQQRTYGQVAAAIGRPTAARAVARACATNPVALIVPCHRVVAGDGSSGGYRWGVGRKKALLALEGRGAGETGARQEG